MNEWLQSRGNVAEGIRTKGLLRMCFFQTFSTDTGTLLVLVIGSTGTDNQYFLQKSTVLVIGTLKKYRTEITSSFPHKTSSTVL